MFSTIFNKIRSGFCSYEKSKNNTQPTLLTSMISAMTLAVASILFLTFIILIISVTGYIFGGVGVAVMIVFFLISLAALFIMREDA